MSQYQSRAGFADPPAGPRRPVPEHDDSPPGPTQSRPSYPNSPPGQYLSPGQPGPVETRIKRGASADPRDFGEHNIPVRTQGPPAAFQNDAFFNERITIPRVVPVAQNEQEHFATEEYDNKDRGDVEDEEHTFDRQVRHSHFRSGSLPAKRFGERSLFADRSLYHDEKAEAAQRGGGYHYRWNYQRGPDRAILPPPNVYEQRDGGYTEYSEQRQNGGFRNEQAFREEQQRREEEERRRFAASGHRSQAYRSASVGGAGQGGGKKNL